MLQCNGDVGYISDVRKALREEVVGEIRDRPSEGIVVVVDVVAVVWRRLRVDREDDDATANVDDGLDNEERRSDEAVLDGRATPLNKKFACTTSTDLL